jgi:gas vesicle protein
MGAGKILLGILAGVAVGATLGILFAPDKGSSTRKKISKKSDEYVKELEEKFNGFIESISQKYEEIKEEVSDEEEQAQVISEEVKKKVKPAFHKPA